MGGKTTKGYVVEDPVANSSMNLRGLIIFSFFIISLSYILYSTNLLFVNRTNDCPNTNHDPISLALTNSTTFTSSSSFENATVVAHGTKLGEEQAKVKGEDVEIEAEAEAEAKVEVEEETSLEHIVFGIAASSDLWAKRKEYIKQWWRPKSTRGIVWMDKRVRTYRNEGVPEIKISGDTSKFPYKHPHGSRSALRISRIVSETIRLKPKNVRWVVMGDDDTVFIVENVVRVLQKFDHKQFYYIGSSSESHIQNLLFSYHMAYGGGGFAISYPLAVELEKMQDRCIKRYAHLYGSDDRMHACMAELGVPLTRHQGFHQYDIYGDLLGLLAAHPVTPLVSLHHLDVVEPIFPDDSRPNSIRRLLKSASLDSASIMQQSICYDKKRHWSISISWGYVVQISRGLLSPRELEIPARTFLNWYRQANYFAYSFNTRPVARHPCQKPVAYYVSDVRCNRHLNETVSRYARHGKRFPTCRWRMPSPTGIETVVIFKKIDTKRWDKSPRRDCCRVLNSGKGSTMHISVGNCAEGEYAEG